MKKNSIWQNALNENTKRDTTQYHMTHEPMQTKQNASDREEVTGKLNISINTNKELMKEYMDKKKQEIANEIAW